MGLRDVEEKYCKMAQCRIDCDENGEGVVGCSKCCTPTDPPLCNECNSWSGECTYWCGHPKYNNPANEDACIPNADVGELCQGPDPLEGIDCPNPPTFCDLFGDICKDVDPTDIFAFPSFCFGLECDR